MSQASNKVIQDQVRQVRTLLATQRHPYRWKHDIVDHAAETCEIGEAYLKGYSFGSESDACRIRRTPPDLPECLDAYLPQGARHPVPPVHGPQSPTDEVIRDLLAHSAGLLHNRTAAVDAIGPRDCDPVLRRSREWAQEVLHAWERLSHTILAVGADGWGGPGAGEVQAALEALEGFSKNIPMRPAHHHYRPDYLIWKSGLCTYVTSGSDRGHDVPSGSPWIAALHVAFAHCREDCPRAILNRGTVPAAHDITRASNDSRHAHEHIKRAVAKASGDGGCVWL